MYFVYSAAADSGAGVGAALRGGAGALEGGADWQPRPSTASRVARP